MIMLVAGTRPEVIKLMPVWQSCRRLRLPVQWFWTDQQPEIGMETFEAFKVEPQLRLEMKRHRGTLTELMALLSQGLETILTEQKPRMVVVQGDTLSAAVAAQQAFLGGIPTAHVEAGLRSWDTSQPYPEEACRVWIDSIADVKFAPTSGAAFTLSGEVYVTGNTAIDALNLVRPKRPVFRRYAVVTLHRRENAKGVEDVCRAIKTVLKDRIVDQVIWPVHPNPIVRDVVPKMMSGPGVRLTKPLPYDQSVNLLRFADMVFTDSGGIQEECLGLSVPCIVMRETTERPEGVQAGGAVLVGTKQDRIVGEAFRIASDLQYRRKFIEAVNPYGDGKAGPRIASVLKAKLGGKKVDRHAVEWST